MMRREVGEMPNGKLAGAVRGLCAFQWYAVMAELLLTACAGNSYMGIEFADGRTSPEVRELAALAQTGDKRAQLELGIRFEEGRGVKRDVGPARNLYRLAAADSGGPVWVYSPPVREGEAGRVLQVGAAPKQTGLEEACRRLKALEMRQTK